MPPRVNYNPVAIYDSLSLQNHRLSYSYGDIAPIPVLKDNILPFQFPVTVGGSVTVFKVVKLDDGTETDILSNINASGLQVIAFENYSLVVYNATAALSASLGIGRYYFYFTVSAVTYYSEVFAWRDSVDDLIKIEAWHGDNINYEGGLIRYRAPYKSTIYIQSDVGQPTYPYEEEVQKRDGRNFPIQQISYKLHKFIMLTPEYLVDFMRLIRIHHFVEITYKGQTHKVDEFIMNDPSWQGNGNIASLTIEFKTDSVIVENSRGLEDLTYAQVTVLTSCPTAIEGRYTDHAAAGTGGVVADEYFAITSQSGIVIQLDATQSFYNDTEASAQLTEDSCYAVVVGNQYALPKNAVRKLNPTLTYNTDVDATAGGIAVDGIYYTGFSHERAVPYGTAVIRLT